MENETHAGLSGYPHCALPCETGTNELAEGPSVPPTPRAWICQQVSRVCRSSCMGISGGFRVYPESAAAAGHVSCHVKINSNEAHSSAMRSGVLFSLMQRLEQRLRR